MYTEINTRLVEIQGNLRKKDKYEMQLADFKRELETIEERLSQLRVQFHSEQKEVEKLESVSLTNLFATLTGKKDEKLTKKNKRWLQRSTNWKKPRKRKEK